MSMLSDSPNKVLESNVDSASLRRHRSACRWAIPGCVVRPTSELLGLGGIATIPDAIASRIVAAYVRPSIAGRSWPIQPAAGNAGQAPRLQFEPRRPGVPEPSR